MALTYSSIFDSSYLDSFDPSKLSLTKEEGQALAAVLAKVGGDTKNSGRRHIDSVTKKLMTMGYYSTYSPFKTKLIGGIRFEDDFTPGFYQAANDSKNVRWLAIAPTYPKDWRRVEITKAKV